MAARKASLHAVKPGDTPPAPAAEPKTVGQAAKTGTQRELLVALRDRIAKTVEDVKTPPRDLAALSRRLLEITKEIDVIDAAGGEGNGGRSEPTPDEAWSESAI